MKRPHSVPTPKRAKNPKCRANQKVRSTFGAARGSTGAERLRRQWVLRHSRELLPELALEPRIAFIALVVDLLWRPFTRTSSVTPTLRVGYSLFTLFATGHIVAVAAGIEWREVLGGAFGVDVGSLLATWIVADGAPRFSPCPTVNMYFGYAF